MYNVKWRSIYIYTFETCALNSYGIIIGKNQRAKQRTRAQEVLSESFFPLFLL